MCHVRRLQHDHDVDTAAVMLETFDARKEWIQQRTPPVRTIFALFPPLKDVLSPHVSRISVASHLILGEMCYNSVALEA